MFSKKKKTRAKIQENVFKEYLDLLSYCFNVQTNLNSNLPFTKFILQKVNLTDKNSVVYQTTSDFISMILSQPHDLSQSHDLSSSISNYSPDVKKVGVDEICNAFIVVNVKKQDTTETDKNTDFQKLVNPIESNANLDILYTNIIGDSVINAPQPAINIAEKIGRAHV